MTKEEFIKQEWIKLIGEEEFSKIEIDVDGYLEVSERDFHYKYNCSLVGDWDGKGYNPFQTIREHEANPKPLYVRPKILGEMKKNNGWTKIENEEDLPKETGHYWVKRGNEICINYIKVKESLNFNFLKNLTHYKKIEELKPPIY